VGRDRKDGGRSGEAFKPRKGKTKKLLGGSEKDRLVRMNGADWAKSVANDSQRRGGERKPIQLPGVRFEGGTPGKLANRVSQKAGVEMKRKILGHRGRWATSNSSRRRVGKYLRKRCHGSCAIQKREKRVLTGRAREAGGNAGSLAACSGARVGQSRTGRGRKKGRGLLEPGRNVGGERRKTHSADWKRKEEKKRQVNPA